MEPVAKLAALTVATLLALSQLFSEGIADYQKKNYDKAIVSFTKAINEKVESNPFYQPSLYWRAQCYTQLKKTNEAVADLNMLIEKAPDGELAALAAADFRTLTGKDRDGLSLGSPEEAWASVCAAVRRRDQKALLCCFSGKMKRELESELSNGHNPDRMWKKLSEIMAVTVAEVRYNTGKAAALVTFKGGPLRDRVEPLIAEKTGGKWIFARESRHNDEAEFGAPVKPVPVERAAVALTDAERTEIETLISQLGAPEAKVRKDAYGKLRTIGGKAAKLLEKAQASSDPEIAAQAKILLSDL